jgi:hypothetical protein
MRKNGLVDTWNDGLLPQTPANEQLISSLRPHQSIEFGPC